MTELGDIPSEWAISKIGELTEIKTGGTPSTKCEKYWKDGDIPWMASGDVNKKIINEVDARITKSGMENSAAKLLPKDTVMIALNGQGKTKGTVAYLNIELTCNQSLAGFLPSYNVFNSKYLYYNLQSRYFEIRGLAGDGARNGLNLGLLREILIPIPSIKEQEKIASILSTVDEQIDNVDALIEKNKELKKGLMQTLLTKGIGHTKFKKTEIGEIPEEWEVSNLTNIVDIKGRVGWKGYTKKDLVEFGPLAIGAMHINSNNKLDLSEPVYLSKKKYEESPEIMVSKDDIILAQRGSLGKVVLIEKEIGEATINPSMVLIKNIKINSRYLYYFLCSEYIQKVIFKETSQTSIPMISQEQIGKFKIIIPTIKEQEKIASILSEVDKKIEEYENKKQKLEKLKKGLMQQLLTGMIRVTV